MGGTLAIVLVVLLIAEVGARVVEPHLPRQTGSEQRAIAKARQMEARGHTDIAIIGSSEAAAGIDPDVLLSEVTPFRTAYNAGLVGSHLSVTDLWYRRVVQPELTPDVVIIGLLPLAVLPFDDVQGDVVREGEADEWLRETKRTFLENSRVYEATIDQITPEFFGPMGRTLMRRSALLRTRSQLRSPTTIGRTVRGLIGTPDDDEADVVVDIGPTGQNLEYSGPGGTERPADEIELYRAAMAQPPDITVVASIIETVRSSGAEPVLALAPIDRLSLGADGLDLERWSDRLDELRDWAAANDVPLNDQFVVDYDEDAFHDRHHLRRAGAERWSREVGRWIEEICRDGLLRSC